MVLASLHLPPRLSVKEEQEQSNTGMGRAARGGRKAEEGKWRKESGGGKAEEWKWRGRRTGNTKREEGDRELLGMGNREERAGQEQGRAGSRVVVRRWMHAAPAIQGRPHTEVGKLQHLSTLAILSLRCLVQSFRQHSTVVKARDRATPHYSSSSQCPVVKPKKARGAVGTKGSSEIYSVAAGNIEAAGSTTEGEYLGGSQGVTNAVQVGMRQAALGCGTLLSWHLQQGPEEEVEGNHKLSASQQG